MVGGGDIIGTESKPEKREVEVEKGVGGVETYEVKTNKYSEIVYEYYILKRTYKPMYYLEFKWKKLKRKAGSTVNRIKISLGKGASAKAEYDKLPVDKRDKIAPSNPFMGAGEKVPS
jgi:hypothetical protein